MVAMSRAEHEAYLRDFLDGIRRVRSFEARERFHEYFVDSIGIARIATEPLLVTALAPFSRRE